MGVDTGRLGRVAALADHYVDSGKVAGVQVQVAHRGRVLLRHTVGRADLDAGTDLADDAIFRIYSMTKPITSVALMQLYEQGLVLLEDPIANYIPEFGDAVVWVAGNALSHRTRPAARPITVRDVLTHTAGLTYGFFQSHPVDELYRDDGLGELELPEMSLEEAMVLLAAKPLLFDPGSAWNYSIGTDVCGRLVEVISGERLDAYFDAEIFSPLGMTDTGFCCPERDLDRLVTNYELGSDGKLVAVSGNGPEMARRPPFLSGGGGLLSTTDDYQRFVGMLLDGGVLDGRRILGRKTVEYMITNHLPGGKTLNEMGQSTFSETVMEGMGFGLGFSVVVDPAAHGAVTSVGEFAWGGAASTAFFIDPVEEITVVFMTQFMPSTFYPIRRQLKATVYQAII